MDVLFFNMFNFSLFINISQSYIFITCPILSESHYLPRGNPHKCVEVDVKMASPKAPHAAPRGCREARACYSMEDACYSPA